MFHQTSGRGYVHASNAVSSVFIGLAQTLTTHSHSLIRDFSTLTSRAWWYLI